MDKKLFLSIIGVIFVITLSLTALNLDDPYFWYDESAQFWMSKGLNADSDPLQQPGNIRDAIQNNALYNYHPAGFTLLLHFWSQISNGYLWLRILPFLFYLGTILVFIVLSYSWTKDPRISVLVGFIPLLDKFILAMGFELRGYGMAYLGVMLGVTALYSIIKEFSYQKLFLWSLLLSIFMTSLISIIVYIFVLALLIFWYAIKDKLELKHIFRTGLIWGGPLLFTALMIYFFSFRVQNPGLEKLSYLPYLQESWLHLISPRFNLAFLILLITITLLPIFIRAFELDSLNKYLPLYHLSSATSWLFMLLSFLGHYPWLPNNKYGLTFSILIILSCSTLVGEILVQVFKRKIFLIDTTVIALLFFPLFTHLEDRYFHRIHYRDSKNKIQCLETLDYSKYSKIYVDRWASPIMRYQFEYGALANSQSASYPEQFHFQKSRPAAFTVRGENAKSRKPTMDELEDFDLIIVPDPIGPIMKSSDIWQPIDNCEMNIFYLVE